MGFCLQSDKIHFIGVQAHIADKLLYRHWTSYNDGRCNHLILFDTQTKTYKEALIGKGYVAGQKVILAKPQTFMNLSGESIREIVDYYKVDDTAELIVISDDISLDVGQIRIRKKGSAGGHNGLKNIIKMLGHDTFIRVRMGVGEKPKNFDLADYVLGHFPAEERSIMDEAAKTAAEAIRMIITENADAAMNHFNSKKA